MDKVISAVVTIVLVLCGLQVALHYCVVLIEWAIGGLCRALPGFLGAVVDGLVAWMFLLGLLARLRRRLQQQDPHAARRGQLAAQRARVAVRRPAEDVPVHDGYAPEPEEDLDPELNPQERGHD